MEWFPYFLLTTTVIIIAVHIVLAWRMHFQHMREQKLIEARRDFHYQRERLEAKFVAIAADQYESNVWLWEDALFDDDVTFARNRFTNELTAYVSVTVERVRPNLMASLANKVSNIRSATLVYYFDGKRWETKGRAIINLSPEETLNLYKRELELVEAEMVRTKPEAAGSN